MMRKFCLLVLSLVLGGISMVASAAGRNDSAPDTISVRRAFTDLPISVLDILSRSTRLDMLDYADADSLLVAVNALEGHSRILRILPDFMQVEVTPVSDLTIKILHTSGHGDVVMTLYTVGKDPKSADSDIRFFNSSLEELPREKFFRIPELKHFFDKGKMKSASPKVTDKDLEEKIPFPTIIYTCEPDSPLLKGVLTVGKYLPIEDRDYIAPYILPELVWQWDGKGFKQLK